MDNCLAESDAVTILVRRNAVWPSTIMRIAMEGEHKVWRRDPWLALHT